MVQRLSDSNNMLQWAHQSTLACTAHHRNTLCNSIVPQQQQRHQRYQQHLPQQQLGTTDSQ